MKVHPYFRFSLIIDHCSLKIDDLQGCPYSSRSFFLKTFPIGFLGKASMKTTDLGRLKPANLDRQYSMISSEVATSPFFKTTIARGSCPHSGSDTPMTDASSIFG